METEVVVRKWGNSLGIVLPQIFVDSNDIKENEKIKVEIKKEQTLKGLFGVTKNIGFSLKGQEAKNIVKEGWKSDSKNIF